MALTSSAKKVALIFFPQKLMKGQNVIGFIEVYKRGSEVKYDVSELNEAILHKYFSDLPKQARDFLFNLTNIGLVLMQAQIEKRFKQQSAGVRLQQFLPNAIARSLQERFEFLKPFAGLSKWYHQVVDANGKVLTAPCVFSVFKPLLQFEVTAQDTVLQLITWVSINGTTYDSKEFQRFGFMLLSRNEYFLLANKDYQTLEWLAASNPQQYNNSPALFAEHILSRLEGDYAVERNNLFPVQVIEVPARQRVLLSEISNSFLMFTPQWLYDGYLVEGDWKEHFETLVKGEQVLVKRNKESELAFKKQLEALHPNFATQYNGYYYLSFAEAQKKQWFLKVYHQLLDMDIELVGMDLLSHFRYSVFKPVTHLQVKSKDSNSYLADFSLKFDKEKIPTAELQKMLIAGQRAVMLKDGTLGVLSDAWLKEYGTIIKHSKVVNQQMMVPQWLSITQHRDEDANAALKITVSDDWWQKWDQWQQPEEKLYDVPEKICAELRPYQQKGFEWLKLLAEINAGACLADDMGLGKTLQTICFITDRLQAVGNGIAIIVCPASLIYNWQQEILKFAPHLRTSVYHGVARQFSEISFEYTDVCITSYGTVRSDIEQLAQIEFEVGVADESHSIKNPLAKTTRSMQRLNVKCKVALSGTPVMNNTFDLYSQLEFLLPGMFGTQEFFKKEYADAIDRDGNPEKIATLQKITAPFILRRTKEQVAKDLPEKTETILWCKMRMEQQDMYDSIKESVKSNLFLNIKSEGLGKSKLAVLQGIMKLKQLCSSPLLLPAEEQTTSYSVKTELLLNELAMLGDHKVLVFSQFTKMLHLLASELDKNSIAYYQLDGSTPVKKRAEMVAGFQQEDDNAKVFLISLMAGNTGLNLTAADYVFLFDPWWNDAVQQQAIDRTHRIGQTKNVFAYKMICKDTIEEKIVQLQQRKTTLSDHLIGNTEGFVKQLTKEDIDFLFE